MRLIDGSRFFEPNCPLGYYPCSGSVPTSPEVTGEMEPSVGMANRTQRATSSYSAQCDRMHGQSDEPFVVAAWNGFGRLPKVRNSKSERGFPSGVR
jgi:hypothetical protein